MAKLYHDTRINTFAIGMTRICLVLVFHFSIMAFSTMVSETTKAPPVAPENIQRLLVAREGARTFTLTCPADSSSPLLVSWTKDGEQVTPAWTRLKPVNRERDLRIRNVALEDAGLYKCHAANGFGSVDMEFTLKVIGKDDPPYEYSDLDYEDDEKFQPKELKGSTGRPPFWVKSEQIKEQTKKPLLYTRGSTVRLKCLATGHPVPDIMWTKDEEPLDTDQMSNKWILFIRHLKPSDVGKYSCRVVNMFGSLNATFKIGLIDDKPEFEKTLLNATVPEGQTASFQCRVRSTITPTIKWIKRIDSPNFVEDNKTFVYEGRLFRVLEVNPPEPIAYPNNTYMKQLIILNVRPQDAGWYFCVVADTIGNIVNRSANLKVISVVHPLTVDESMPLHVAIGVPVALLLLLVVGYAIYFLQKHQQKPGNGNGSGQNGAGGGRVSSSGGRPSRHSIGRSSGGVLPQPPNYPPPLAPGSDGSNATAAAAAVAAASYAGRSTSNAPLIANAAMPPASCATAANNGASASGIAAATMPNGGVALASASRHSSGAAPCCYVMKDAYKAYHRLDPMACVPLNNGAHHRDCVGGASTASGSGKCGAAMNGAAAGVAAASSSADPYDDVSTPQPYELNFEHSEFSDCYDSGVGAGPIQHYPSLYSFH